MLSCPVESCHSGCHGLSHHKDCGCKKRYHLLCAMKEGAVFAHDNGWGFYCKEHSNFWLHTQNWRVRGEAVSPQTSLLRWTEKFFTDEQIRAHRSPASLPNSFPLSPRDDPGLRYLPKRKNAAAKSVYLSPEALRWKNVLFQAGDFVLIADYPHRPTIAQIRSVGRTTLPLNPQQATLIKHVLFIYLGRSSRIVPAVQR